MALSAAEEDLREQFGLAYAQSHLPVMQRIERAVCGCDYGGVSWATREEIDQVSAMLALRPGQQLMDLGAGSGWPGIYLAKQSGCDITLIDLPAEGLAVAAKRAEEEELPGACHVAVADGRALPCANASFDAITHSDVLCCLPGKEAVLVECRRVIRGDGQMVFSVISVAPGLNDANLARAIEIGPPYVASQMPYDDMLSSTGWKVEERRDRTLQFLDCAEIFKDASLDNRAELAALMSEAELSDRLARDTALIEVIAGRLLRRELYRVKPC